MIWENGHWRDGTLHQYFENGNRTWIYEVIRVQEACPVFISEHLDRLWQGATNNHVPLLFEPNELAAGIFALIKKGLSSVGNIRIQVDQESGLTLMGVIPHRYPSPDDYQNGISVALLQTERSNPNVKSWNPLVRQYADRHMNQTASYEVVLVDQEGYLTEGSRSNLFGIQNGRLITPPLEQVLPGITRQILLRLAHENKIPLKEARIHQTELYQFESFFISGTSPGILPVRKIDDHSFSPDSSIIRKLSALYRSAIEQNIDQTVKSNRNPK
ncbi:MAG: aminotransferase class IV [Bacteroidota bacterium]|nr:aminotransferase class IV [Bacteroidota bacterium]